MCNQTIQVSQVLGNGVAEHEVKDAEMGVKQKHIEDKVRELDALIPYDGQFHSDPSFSFNIDVTKLYTAYQVAGLVSKPGLSPEQLALLRQQPVTCRVFCLYHHLCTRHIEFLKEAALYWGKKY